ncbi:uncharacterized protein LOC143048236 [Mytilus galloprovincialis]|uniref:uncharacterized protein LOC143048236 n=1 Tax=Mytilus galloprovincialis TaxID=29158 RepID=UPI003F7BF7D3
MYGMYTEGWYKFSGNENVLTKPPKPGQCGSSTPIWFDGQYPTSYAEVLTVTACVVGNDTDCEHSWNVSVMHCEKYNVAYYGSPQYYTNSGCGRYCMEYTNDPCSNYSVIDYDSTRHQDYYNQSYMYMYNCDSFWSGGWYYFEGGYSLLTIPPLSGQCGSHYPIWINETIEQTYDTDLVYLRACEGDNWSDCAYTWSIPTMKCGNKNVMYLRQKGMCGRFCLESRNSSDPSYVWDMPCHWHNIITSNFERSVNYTLQSGEYEDCYDWEIHTKAWYRFSGNESIPTHPPKQGQCGSSSPIWLDGLYLTTYGEIASLTACMVGNDTECENSWSMNVMHCDGFNVAELKPTYYDIHSCGKYCMEYTNDPCSNYSVIDYDSTRHQDYYDYLPNCDSFWSGGWYYFEDGYNLATSRASSGQCGTQYPIWINETIEQTDDTNLVYLRACEVEYGSDCAYTWSIPTMKCGTKNIMYLRQKGMCGRFCLDSKNSYDVSSTPSYVWDEPCHWHNIITSNFERSVSYAMQSGEYEDCYDWEIHTEAWYKFSGNESIPTHPPKQGQCGSSSPIWLNGLYPTTYGGMASLTACVVGNDTDCKNSWNVTVMHCDGYNVAKLKPTYYDMNSCAKYCMEYTSDPCSNYSVIDYDSTRHQDYYNQSNMYMYNCDSFWSGGWYYFEGGYNLLTIPPLSGQCGSHYPIWINETIEQTYDTDLVYMRACQGDNWSDCAYTWSIPTMKCGNKNVMYLRQKGMCGRFCLESRNSSDPSYVWDMPCHWHNIVTSNFERSVNYTLQSGEYEDCYDWEIHTKAWYRFSGNESIPTHPPKQGQCGSSSPIWLDGLYPTTYGEIASLTACMVGNDTECENSWSMNVMHCDGFNVAELKPTYYDMHSCGKYCMEYTNDPCSNYSVIDYDSTRHQDYYDESPNCDSFWSGGWYYFEDGYNLATSRASYGQCGTQYPIWINETIEQTDDTNLVYLRACEVEYGSDCAYTWSIPTMKCGTKNIMYLRQKGMCGRFCLDSKNSYDVSSTPSYVWDEPCHWHNIITSNFERSVSYAMQSGEYEDCYDWEIHTEAWYKFSGNESIPTHPPKQGQCGSSSPIWLNGLYPSTYGGMASLTACVVGNDTDCKNSWNVTVMHCDGYNVAKLKPTYYDMNSCAKYCMEYTSDPCSNYSVIDYDSTRHQDYYNQSNMYMYNCDSFWSGGWYYFEGGYNLLTIPPLSGQCGSHYPIWINETIEQTYDTDLVYMRACQGDNWSDCAYTWSIPTMKCGNKNVMYLRQKGMCGRFCLESRNSSDPSYVWDMPCHWHNIITSNFERSVNYTLQNGAYEDCYDWEIYTKAWYRFSGNESIPTHPPKQGQCGSSSPIWLDGLYPTSYGEIASLTACMVGNDTECENSWSMNVMHCDGFNVAELKPTYYDIHSCGKYCMEYTNDPCSNYSVIDYDSTRHLDFYDESPNCDSFWSGGWYYFEDGYNLATSRASSGQCGTQYPIWINETIEQTDDTNLVYLRACEVGYASDCAYTWSIPTMKCGTKNIMYLRQKGMCGRFCLETAKDSSMTPTTVHMSSSKYHVTLSDNLDKLETSIYPSSSLFESHKTDSLSSSENWDKVHMDISLSSKDTDMSIGDLADSLTSDLEIWNTMEIIVQSSSEWIYRNEYDKTTILTSSYLTHDLYSTSDIPNELDTVLASISSKIDVDATKTTSSPSSFNENWYNMETTVKTLSSSFNLDQ